MHKAEAVHHVVELNCHFYIGLVALIILIVVAMGFLSDFLDGEEIE